MNDIKNFVINYKHFAILLYYLVFSFFFNYLEATIIPKYYMEGWIDQYIPFIKVFVVPYVLWFFYIVATLIYLGFKSREDFCQLCIFMFGGMSICLVLYYLFPNGQNLRPLITETDIFSRMIAKIYAADTPTNVAPSIHVLNSVAVHIALIRFAPFSRIKWLKVGSFLMMVSIVLSTVLIKQHAAIDGLYSLLLCVGMYYFTYHLVPMLSLQKGVYGTLVEESAISKELD